MINFHNIVTNKRHTDSRGRKFYARTGEQGYFAKLVFHSEGYARILGFVPVRHKFAYCRRNNLLRQVRNSARHLKYVDNSTKGDTINRKEILA